MTHTAKYSSSEGRIGVTATNAVEVIGNSLHQKAKIGDTELNGIWVKLIDTFLGMDAYQPFFTTKPTGEGTGLGLSLSYDIIRKGHGGEMRVETKEGEGAAFIIALRAI
jgi:signal transduction histidine kinase